MRAVLRALSRRWLLGVLLLAGLPASAQPGSPASLGALIERLSEPGAYFDTDNLISNERSFVRGVEQLEARGGVYLGVGPEQNYHYIARTRPQWAFIVDIRRDNMVQHLLLHAVLAESETPEEYLRTLFALEPAAPSTGPQPPSLSAVLERVGRAQPSAERLESNLKRFERRIAAVGIRLTERDLEHLRSVYRQFAAEQLGLRFRSHGRGYSPRHPSYGELVAARTSTGAAASFLGSLDDYRFVRDLALSGRLVPVVGDFAGDGALRRIGDLVREQGLEVTTFYTSNVEYYLLRNGSFGRYVANVESLPLSDDGVFVRAYFDYGMGHPDRLPGHRSATVLQRFPDFLQLYRAGRLRSYWDVCTLARVDG